MIVSRIIGGFPRFMKENGVISIELDLIDRLRAPDLPGNRWPVGSEQNQGYAGSLCFYHSGVVIGSCCSGSPDQKGGFTRASGGSQSSECSRTLIQNATLLDTGMTCGGQGQRSRDRKSVV